jgi:hypothetical protein
MAKNSKSLDTGKPKSRQLNLFDEIKKIQEVKKVEEKDITGGLFIQAQFREALARALAKSNLSRYQIAGKMSDLLAMDISKYMLDSWVAESKDGHRFPAEYLPAFCKATGSNEPVEIICQRLNLFVMPCHDALRSEVQLINEEINRLRHERQKRMAFLGEIGGGNNGSL